MGKAPKVNLDKENEQFVNSLAVMTDLPKEVLVNNIINKFRKHPKTFFILPAEFDPVKVIMESCQWKFKNNVSAVAINLLCEGVLSVYKISKKTGINRRVLSWWRDMIVKSAISVDSIPNNNQLERVKTRRRDSSSAK